MCSLATTTWLITLLFKLQVDFPLLSALTPYNSNVCFPQVLEKENTYLSSECRNLKKIHQEYQAHLDKGKQDRKKLEKSNRDSLELMNRSVDKLQDYEAQISQLEQEVSCYFVVCLILVGG